MTKFEYDPQGNVTKFTEPTNQPTLFEYEPTFNRVKKITDALNQITEFTYDPPNGNLLTVKDPRNQVTTIAYNTFGQPLSVQGPIATEPPTTFAYDTNGNLITTTDPLGNSTQRVYDAVSRLTSLTDPRGLSTQFRYDGLNRVTEIAVPYRHRIVSAGCRGARGVNHTGRAGSQASEIRRASCSVYLAHCLFSCS